MFGKKQKGLSPVMVLLLVLNFALFLVAGLKIVPHYLEFFQIKKVFEEKVAASPNEAPSKIKSDIGKQLRISSIRSFDLDDAYITKEDGELVVGFEYEVRENLMGNLDVIMLFTYDSEE